VSMLVRMRPSWSSTATATSPGSGPLVQRLLAIPQLLIASALRTLRQILPLISVNHVEPGHPQEPTTEPRVIAYAALMTDAYPPFRLDQGGAGAPAPAPDDLASASAARAPAPGRTGQLKDRVAVTNTTMQQARTRHVRPGASMTAGPVPRIRQENSMDNRKSARARQRILAIFLPVTAVLYISAEALSPNPPPGSSPARRSARSSRTTAHPPPQPDPQPRRTPPMAHIHTAARPAGRLAARRPLRAPLALALALAAPATSRLAALTSGLRGTGSAISFPHGFVTALTGGTP
jgi:hypothetical protein